MDMKPFALVGLFMFLITGIWWAISHFGATYDETGLRVDSTSGDEIDLSRAVAEEIAETVRISEPVMVYDDIIVPSHARELNLSNRALEGSLKAEIRFLAELRGLDISGNNFTGLPAELGQLTKLENLNLSHNPLTGLPHELANLHNLQVLDLRSTNYSEYDLTIIKQGLPATVQILTE
jgi:hypothetical protein